MKYFRISPASHILIKKHNIDINHLSLSNNVRFITKEIILNHLSSSPRSASHTHTIKHNPESELHKPDVNIQAYNVDIKDSSKNLNDYKTALPHIYFSSSCQANQLLESLRKLNGK